MKKILSTLLLTVCFQHVFAQGGGINVPITDDQNTVFLSVINNTLDRMMIQQEISKMSSAKTASFEDVGGTNRFFSIDWLAGGAVTYQNKTVRTDRYRYNYDFIAHQLFATSGDSIIAVDPDHLKLFYLTDVAKTHTFCKFPAIGVNDFEELLSADTAAGKLKLIKQRNVTIVKYVQTNANAALTGDKDDLYQDAINYFILFKDNKAVKINLTKKSLMENLKPEYKAWANELLRGSNKINEESLAKLVNDINAN